MQQCVTMGGKLTFAAACIKVRSAGHSVFFNLIRPDPRKACLHPEERRAIASDIVISAIASVPSKPD